MSTRGTIWYREETEKDAGIHVYSEMIEEDWPIHMEITRGPFSLVLALPDDLLDVFKRLQR